MTGKRGELARCMTFSLEHAEAASEVRNVLATPIGPDSNKFAHVLQVSDIIVASLLVDSTPVPRKVARLHLICDILHNSAASVPNAWKFRQEFQARLGIVFDHLSSIYHSFPGRITAETFKKQIVLVLDIWENWIVFPPDYIAILKSRLEGKTESEKKDADEQAEIKQQSDDKPDFTSKFKSSSFKTVDVIKEETPAATADDDDMELDSESEEQTGDIDGEAVDDDIDGEPTVDLDGDPIVDDDIDGMPI